MIVPRTPFVAGVLLAAGGSTRFEGGPKQLARFAGETLVARAARAALGSRLRQVIVVVGHAGAEVAAELARLTPGVPAALEVAVNAIWAEGQSTSVRVGLERVDPRAEAAIFLPCDQPFLDVATIDAVVDVFARGRAAVVIPVHGRRRGAPALFARALFPELRALEGDVGGRAVADRHPERVELCPLVDERPLLDVDDADDLRRLRALSGADGEGRRR